ncbi:adenosine deaminase [Propionicicella superfundia]|uniref:adenosine deaminase n=1 Tax=Propionicicella superfundia TaxID=348582 RepID=UPI00048CD807|nr:adenosine deaminase [Propionicicella superfundia]
MTMELETIRQVPKVALHDHLDGGLRPATVLELARDVGHETPAGDAASLADWFRDQSNAGSLAEYLKTFSETVAVMQTPDALRRVAREFVLDQAADGVVYAEARWAPEQHLTRGLTPAQATEAVRDGLAEGMAQATAEGRPIIARQLITSLRHTPPRRDITRLAVDYRDDSVCGFDLAGPEDGFPAVSHVAEFEYLRRNNVLFTIHAGEAAGPSSVWEAVQLCGARRLGHGVRIVEDVDLTTGRPAPGGIAAYVRDVQIPLEVCPTSNVMTGISDGIDTHPVDVLLDLGFAVTISCDNRLMSDTTLSRELAALSAAFGYDADDLLFLTLNAAQGAFLPLDERVQLIDEVILPGFAAVTG